MPRGLQRLVRAYVLDLLEVDEVRALVAQKKSAALHRPQFVLGLQSVQLSEGDVGLRRLGKISLSGVVPVLLHLQGDVAPIISDAVLD